MNHRTIPTKDPYRIYERLAKIYVHHYTGVGVLGLTPFLKWVYQEIPDCFWKYNVYIDANMDALMGSASRSILNQIWVDMKGIKNKLKCVELNKDTLLLLDNGTLYMPSYKQICKEVSTWGQYTYEYGNIVEIKTVWKGV